MRGERGEHGINVGAGSGGHKTQPVIVFAGRSNGVDNTRPRCYRPSPKQLLEEPGLRRVYGIRINPRATGGGVSGDAMDPAAGSQHLHIIVTRPLPTQPMCGECVIKGSALQFGGIGQRAEGSEENSRH